MFSLKIQRLLKKIHCSLLPIAAIFRRNRQKVVSAVTESTDYKRVLLNISTTCSVDLSFFFVSLPYMLDLFLVSLFSSVQPFSLDDLLNKLLNDPTNDGNYDNTFTPPPTTPPEEDCDTTQADLQTTTETPSQSMTDSCIQPICKSDG